jgi:hypothetical protein
MSLDQTANFARGELDAGATADDTSITVIDATQFPDPANGEFNLVVFDQTSHARADLDPDVEIVRATSRQSSTELSVTRGQEATAAVGHPAGSAVMLASTSKVFDDIAADISSVQANVSANDTDISNLQSDVSANDSDINTLQSDVSDNTQAINNFQGLPTGAIVMWGGAINNIPSGFSLCDGTNGTPDLTDRFVQGAGGALSQEQTGGSSTDTVNISGSDSVNISISDNVSVSGQTGRMQFKGGTAKVRGDNLSLPAEFGLLDRNNEIGPPAVDRLDKGSDVGFRFGILTGGTNFNEEDVRPLRGSFSGSGTVSDSDSDTVNISDSDTVNTEPPFLALAYIQKD